MAILRLAIFAIATIGLTTILSGSGQSFDPDEDPYPCLDERDQAVAEYRELVKSCLEVSSDLEEAQECWKEE